MDHLDSQRLEQHITRRSYVNDTHSPKTINAADNASIAFNLAAFSGKKRGCLFTIIFAVFSQLKTQNDSKTISSSFLSIPYYSAKPFLFFISKKK